MHLQTIDEAAARPPAAPAGARRRGLLIAAKLAISAGLLGAVLAAGDPAALAALLSRLAPGPALAAVLLLAAITAVSGLRWWLVGRAIGAPLALKDCVALMFVGGFFTQVLPTSVGGDAVRVLLAGRRGVPYGKAFNGVMLERASGLVALVLVVAGGVLWLGARLQPPVLATVLLLALPALAAVLAALCLLDRLTLPRRLARLARPFLALAGDTRRVLLSPAISVPLLALSALAQLLVAGAAWFLAQGLGVALGFADSLALVPAVILITFFPLSFAGWGVREGAAVVLLGVAGLAPDAALAVSVLLGLGLLVAGLPGLVLWLAGRRRAD
ncbi:MAG: lysylphosphatidylglycerol synthase transmembrane domain-containing protein [Bacteroidota bacterium]